MVVGKLLLCAVFFIAAASDAAAIHPRTRNFTKDRYHAGTQNWAITQNQARVLYFANNGGLLEFDGLKWELYPIPRGTALRSALWAEDESRIYAGSYNEAGYFELDGAGRFRYISLREKLDGQDLGEIWDIHRVGGALCFRGDRHIVIQDGGRVRTFGFGERISCSAAVNGSLFVSAPATGLQLLSGDMFITIPGSERLRGKSVCAMLPHGGGGVLIVTSDSGFYLYDGRIIEKYRTPLDGHIARKRIISAAANEHFLALGTVKDGLLVYDLRNETAIVLDRSTGMQNNTVLSLGFDLDGNLWAGLDNGIDYILLDLPEYRLFGARDSYGAGYASLTDGDILYLGTAQGLFMSRDPGALRQAPRLEAVPGMEGQVWSLARIGGTVFCSHDLGLFEISEGRARRIGGIDGVWKTIPVAGHGDLIVGCSYSGLFVLKKKNGRWAFSNMISGFGESSRVFEEDRDGRIWFSHWIKGLFRLTLDSDYRTVTHVEYYGVNHGMPTERNNIPFRLGEELVFSSEGGFLRHDPLRDTMVYDDGINSLFASPPVSMRVHRSPEGDLIFVSRDSFCAALRQPDGSWRLDSLGLRFLASELIIGFEDLHFLGGRRLLLSNEKGFSIVDYGAGGGRWDRPENLSEPGTESRNASPAVSVIIKNVFLTNTGGTAVYGERFNRRDRPPLTVPKRDNSLRFEFVSPEYRGEDAVEYSCRLENFDREWSAFSPANGKEYTGLKGGDYVFRVRSRSLYSPGVAETSYAFTVLPAWYAGKAAAMVYVLLGAGSVWLTAVYFRRRSQMQVSMIEERKEDEIRQQKKHYEEAARERENELVLHKNRALEYELRNKAQELASSTMNLIRKNEILLKIRDDLDKLLTQEAYMAPWSMKIDLKVKKIRKYIRENIEHDQDWKKFQHNFDMVYENYLQRLTERYPDLNMNDRKLCAYLRMGLHTKEIAPLMDITVRGVEMARYRLRRKLGLKRNSNLSEYLQRF